MRIWQARAAGLLLLQLLIEAASGFPDLQNPHFETPPINMPMNSTNPFVSYQGTMKYVSSSKGNNTIYLGENGKINQTFKANIESNHYYLTFDLQPAQSNCTNPTSVTVCQYLFQVDQLTEKNLLPNGGFEYGPAFPINSYGGILIDAESNETQLHN
ncbi:hypothetical protein MKW94_009887 [Papaver nudicaule]|uniref:DUF642 domain-containing protein n=1 Tax=Papaver nudicaule TaxID=74823 RepID=A0AA41SAB6_PAPNU|nr:hypothetical protein [Papaver nudicaule]